MQVSTRPPTDQRIADAVRVPPYLTHVIRPHGQLPLMPQDNPSSSRKQKREKRPKQERQQRAHEEPHFNIGAPRTPRRGQPGSPGGRSRTGRRPDVSDAGSIPDYPPPSFDEAIAAAAADRNAPPLSPADSTTTHSSSPDRYQPVPILIPPLPRTQNQPVVSRTLPGAELPEEARYSTQAEYDSGSDDGDLEVISASEATSSPTPSEQASPKHPAREGPRLDSKTASASVARSLLSSPSQSTLAQDGGDDRSVSSPLTDSQAGDLLPGPRNLTPPLPPKRRLHLLSGLLKSRDNHPASAPSTPTHAAASQLSLPLHFLGHPGSPSKPHRGESLISRRKLFGHKGKERITDLETERPSESLETWEMLSDVERDVPSSSSSSSHPTPTASPVPVPEHLPGAPGPSDPARAPEPRREGGRSKHRSLLIHRVVPPLPLVSTAQRYQANSSIDSEPLVPASAPLQSMASALSITSSATPFTSDRLPTQSMNALLKPPAIAENSTRGRALRSTSSMIWAPRRRYSPVPSPDHSATTPTSPSTTSLLSSVTSADRDVDTPATTVAPDDQEVILGALPPSLVQEEEEEQFVTPPGSPVRSLMALPLATISSRHPSPVPHEGRPGITLRDDGPVPLGSPTRSEQHTRATCTPTITPQLSVGALRTFAPSNPSPLSNQSFERQAVTPSTPLPAMESVAAPKRDTVVSIGDTESLIELYVHSQGQTATAPVASSVTPTSVASGIRPVQRTPTNSPDPKQHHYPGRPLPHPPGASQSGPVRPVLLDLFLSGNVPAGLPPYTEVESEKQRSAGPLSLQFRQIPSAICLPPSPLVNQPGGYIPPLLPPPGLLAVLDDASEPSSPGSTYEMLPSAPSAMQREFTSLEALETRHDDDGNTTVTGSNREARHLSSSTLAPYCIADPRTPAMTEHDSGTGCHEHRTGGTGTDADDPDDPYGSMRAVQRERGTTGQHSDSATAGDTQWAREAQVGAAWHDRGPVRDMQDAVSRP